MPSIVEVRVCDALSPEDAASLEKDDAPLTPKPPKDFTVSFAESVTRTANVYASSRPPSRRGVSGKEHTRFTSRAQKDATETSAKLDSRRFGGSLPSALERDPALRRVHEEARAARLMAKTYKARMQVAEKAAETYRTKSFAAEVRASRVAADAKKLFGRSSERLSFDTLDVDPGKALARLAKEREASRTKLEQYEQELRSLRRANETLRRARDADRKTFFFEKKVFTQRLAAAAATSASLREETARGRRDARRLALKVRTLEARLFRPEPPTGPDATKHARANAEPEPAPAPEPEPEPAPAPNISPRRVREEEEEAEEAEEEDADTEDVVPVMEENHSLNPALSGSSSGGGEADAPHVVLCVVCVEPESLPAPPGASSAESAESAESVEGVESADVSHEPRVSSGASLSPSLSRLSEDDAPDAPESPGDASVTDEQTTNASPSDAAPRRDRFFFARTTVASRSRAETLAHHRALA